MSNVPTARATRIPVRYVRALLMRGLAVWILSRLGVEALYRFIADSAGRDSEVAAALTNGSPMILAAWTLVLSATLMRLDLYRRQEVALMHNLGIVTSNLILVGVVPAIVMESAMVILR